MYQKHPFWETGGQVITVIIVVVVVVVITLSYWYLSLFHRSPRLFQTGRKQSDRDEHQKQISGQFSPSTDLVIGVT